jgi:hypothetical protein
VIVTEEGRTILKRRVSLSSRPSPFGETTERSGSCSTMPKYMSIRAVETDRSPPGSEGWLSSVPS